MDMGHGLTAVANLSRTFAIQRLNTQVASR